jgi:hypothetical protein
VSAVIYLCVIDQHGIVDVPAQAAASEERIDQLAAGLGFVLVGAEIVVLLLAKALDEGEDGRRGGQRNPSS